MAQISDPDGDVTGTIKILMGVDGHNVPSPTGPVNISAQSQVPSFDTPNTTLFKGNSSPAYTTPTLITLPYSPNATYTIEIHKWIPGENIWDNKPCHNYFLQNVRF